ncbi:hypothetical protein TWF694_003309 [Orbilia ellipsospora]|uniref:Rhodopsin domain-containing protein n=1 Tax=Orbilia ellipsospora TaxID=2528407 RepID=A0AAV9X240_9PEZI
MSTTTSGTAPTVYSSGQTSDDITGLIKLALLSGADLKEFTVPPALNDPNYIPSTRNQQILTGFTLATTTLATIMVIIRFYVRTRQCRWRYTMDDWCLLAGYLMLLSLWVLVLVGVNEFQWGYHTFDMKLASLYFDYKLLYVYEVIYSWALVMIRLSLLFFLGRLFGDASKSFRILNTTLIVCNVLYGIASTFAYTFQCPDVKAAWDLYTKFKSGCKPLYIYYIISAFQLALDFASVLAPVRLVSALTRLTFRKKIEVLAMFSLGLSVCVVSVARCFYLQPVVEGLNPANASVSITICCQLESTLAIVAACIPAARQLFGGLSKEHKISRITGKVVKSFRSIATSTSSKSESTVLGSEPKSQTDTQVGTNNRDSRMLHQHYGNIVGISGNIERIETLEGVESVEVPKTSSDDIEAAAADAASSGHGRDPFEDKAQEGSSRAWSPYSAMGRKYNHQISRYSPTSSPSDSEHDIGEFRPVSPPRSAPRLEVQERPGLSLQMHPSFETTNSGVNSSTNSLELSHWDTLESNHQPAPLTPRPTSSGRSQQDWRDSVMID